MRCVRVVNESRHSVLGGEIRLADTMVTRLRGFLYRRRPAFGEGLFLAPCRGVHMYGMRFPLDVVFVDAHGCVVATHCGLEPGQRTPVYATAKYAIELPCGVIAGSGTTIGDRLNWAPGTMSPVDPQAFLARMREQAGRHFTVAGGKQR